jgi:hypothetical protein
MKLRMLAVLGLVIGLTSAGLIPLAAKAAGPATAPQPAISAEARAVLQRMGASLRSKEFSFQAKTIRVYAGPRGEPLHIFHTLDVTVDRPNRLLVVRNGDDGPSKLVYDGKTLFIYIGDGNRYAALPVAGTIQDMMKEAMGKLGIDFPLADLLTDTPEKSILSGVTAGEVVNRVSLDGAPTLHMYFVQSPGIDLEIWAEDNAVALPLRLIVTYRSLPGEPIFIATFSNWNFAIHPPDSDFAFQPPPGAVKVTLGPVRQAPLAGEKPAGAAR